MGELHSCRGNSRRTNTLPDVFGEMGLHWLERSEGEEGEKEGGEEEGRGGKECSRAEETCFTSFRSSLPLPAMQMGTEDYGEGTGSRSPQRKPATPQREMVGRRPKCGGKKGVRISGWGCILESEPTGFVDGWDVGDAQRRELSRTPPGLWPEHLGGWGSFFLRPRDDLGRSRDWGVISRFSSRSLKCSKEGVNL